MKKKRAKTGKLKEKSKPGLESPCKSPVSDVRTKKRNLEVREEIKVPKKQKKDDRKETKEVKNVKRCEIRDSKTKIKEVSKENRKTRKEKCVDSHLDSESSALNDSPTQEDSEDLPVDSRDQRRKSAKEKDIIHDNIFEKQLYISLSADEDLNNRAKRKNTKPRKTEELKENKKQENKSVVLEKRNVQKKQKIQDKGRGIPEGDKVAPVAAQTPKSVRPPGEERILQPSDPAGEVSTWGQNHSTVKNTEMFRSLQYSKEWPRNLAFEEKH